jgi:hypothetical protein
MGRHDRLIDFLEREAQFLRDRIAGLQQRDVASGVDTSEGSDTRLEEMREEAEDKLAEIEAHPIELRHAGEVERI